MPYHSTNMERWAANTLRLVGIILTSITVICGSLLLILLGQCASQGGFGGSRNPDAAMGYFLGAAVLGIGGIAFIAWLARGIRRSAVVGESVPTASEVPSPNADASGSMRHFSPASQRAIDFLSWSIVAQIVVSVLSTLYSALAYRQMPYMSHFVRASVISFVLFVLPFVVLLYCVRCKLSRAVLGFALGIPIASIMLVLINTLPLITLYMRNPVTLVMLIVPVAIDIAMIILAYQAEQQTGLILPASSLLTTVAVSFVYFYSVHLITRFIFRNFAR